MSSPLAARLAAVRSQIEVACERSGRSTDEVKLVAVSKRQPLELLRQAKEAGQGAFGESQVQEAEVKAAALTGVEWHMIGPLQSNKARRAARLFDVVHSVDRFKVARILNQESARLGKRLDVFIQLNLGHEATKSGFPPEDLETEIRPLRELAALRIVGLMAIPPAEENAEKARSWFRLLRDCRDKVASWSEWADFPGFLSMGMSQDYDVAIEEGATHIRVGKSVFGERP